MQSIASGSLRPAPARPRRSRPPRTRAAAQQPNSGTGLLSWAGALLPQSALVGGAKAGWNTLWRTFMTELAPQSREGGYVRPPSSVKGDARELQAALAGGEELLLFVGNACPWCHRTQLALALRPQGAAGRVRVVPCVDDAERASRGGWVLEGAAAQETQALLSVRCGDLREVYDACTPGGYRGRCTAPLLVSASRRRALSNESAQICAALMRAPGESELSPSALAAYIAADVNQGVYASGFATSQRAYDEAQSRLWAALDLLEALLSDGRRFLEGGDSPSLSDIFLLPTLWRFDAVYAPLFKCGARAVRCEYPGLAGWVQRMGTLEGVTPTLDLEACRRSYHLNLFPLNPGGLVPTKGADPMVAR